jgi:predicted Ser/Thr protein kinase
VYLAFDKHTKEEVAIKLEKEENEEVCTLDREVQILQKLVGLEGIPKLFWNGFE